MASVLLELRSVRRSGPQSGFTLVELMIVVAIVSVLAVVSIAAYSTWVKSSKASGEVPFMLGHFQQREEAYLAENNAYLATGTSESDYFPTPLTGGGSYTGFTTMPASWTSLRIQPGQNGLYCGYVVLTGVAGTSPGGAAAAMYTAAPTRDYFYVKAECDWNGDGGNDGNNVWMVRGDLSISTASKTGEGR